MLEISNKIINNEKETIRQQLFALNRLSIDELRLKWFELLKTSPSNFKRGFLIKGIAYKMQSLVGLSNTSEEEYNLALKLAKKNYEKLNNKNITIDKNNKINALIILPPPGSIIKKIHKCKEYLIKVIEENKFEYNGNLYKSLSAIATEIAGTRWSGYAFFNLKRKIKDTKTINQVDND